MHRVNDIGMSDLKSRRKLRAMKLMITGAVVRHKNHVKYNSSSVIHSTAGIYTNHVKVYRKQCYKNILPTEHGDDRNAVVLK